MQIRKLILPLFVAMILGAMPASHSGSLKAGNSTPRQDASPGYARHFQAGEAMIISLYPDTTHFLNSSFLIDQDGYVDLPIIGRLRVVDYSPQSIVPVLRQKFSSYDLPNIQVRRGIRLAILGGFIRPGLYFVPENATLWEAIQMAGGTQEDDGINKLKVVRGSQIFKSDLSDDFRSPRSLASLGIRSGDQIVVPVPGKISGFRQFLRDVAPFLGLATGVVVALVVRNNNRKP